MCKTSKPLEEMGKRATTSDGYENICKACARTRAKEYYRRNRGKRVAQLTKSTRERRERRSEWLKKLKTSTPCKDCGKLYHYSQLDFDHRAGVEKHASLKRHRNMGFWNFVRQQGWQTVQDEIAKCDIVCANCHRLRTWLRKEKEKTNGTN